VFIEQNFKPEVPFQANSREQFGWLCNPEQPRQYPRLEQSQQQ
jgi:hypothetical protein